MECTIVSGYPGKIDEFKNGIHPGNFKLEPAQKKDNKIILSLLVIGNSKHHIDVGAGLDQARKLTIDYEGDKVAESVVFDLCRAKPGYINDVQQPCIFYVDGRHNQESIEKYHGKKLEHYLNLQNAWFRWQIMNADAEWGKYPGKHRVISDDARNAARWLGMTNKPWMIEIDLHAKMQNCKFCGAALMSNIIKCPTCREIIDPVAYKNLTVPVEVRK